MNFSIFQFSQLQFSFLFFCCFFYSTFTAVTNSILLCDFSNLVFTVYRSSLCFSFYWKTTRNYLFLLLYHSVSVWCVKCAPTSVCARTAFPIPRMFIHHPTLPFCLSFGGIISLKRTRIRIQIKFEAFNVHLLCDSWRKTEFDGLGQNRGFFSDLGEGFDFFNLCS